MPDLSTDEVLERLESRTMFLQDTFALREQALLGLLPLGQTSMLWLISVLDNKIVELKSEIAVLLAGLEP